MIVDHGRRATAFHDRHAQGILGGCVWSWPAPGSPAWPSPWGWPAGVTRSSSWKPIRSATSRPQGYRLHVDSRGLEPLRRLLPAPSYRLVEATCGQFAEPRRLAVLTGRLHHLRTVATGPSVVDGRLVSTAVDRATLRAVLLAAANAAGAEIRWGTAISSASADEEGVEVVDRAGRVERAALLVGADGAASVVAASGAAPRVIRDSGGGSIVGRSPLDAVSVRLLDPLEHGYVVIRGLRTATGLGLLRFTERPDEAGRRLGLPLDPVGDYVMWNVGLRSRDGLAGESPDRLQQLAIRLTKSWHSDVRAVIAGGEPDATFLAPTLQAERPPPWVPSPIVAIGDAAHVMPPDRGSGANLALADAADLVQGLTALDNQRAPDHAALLATLAASQAVMVQRAFAVSEGPGRGQLSSFWIRATPSTRSSSPRA